MRTLLLALWRLLRRAHLGDTRFGEWVLDKYYTLSPGFDFWATVLLAVMIAGYLFL